MKTKLMPGDLCECGRPGVKLWDGPVCARCDAIWQKLTQERLSWHRQLYGEKQKLANKKPLRFTISEARQRRVEMEEQPFLGRLLDLGRELVVVGHGEYRLPTGTY